MVGLDVQFDLGDPIGATAKQPEGEGYSHGFGEIGFGTGFGIATAARSIRRYRTTRSPTRRC